MIDRIGLQDEIPVIKNNLLTTFLNDEYLCKLVSDRYDITTPALDLRYKQIFPYEYTSDTTTDAQAYLMFETRVSSLNAQFGSRHPAVKQVWLYVYCICHERIMMIDDVVAERLELNDPNARGSRVDLMCARVDRLIQGYDTSPFGRFLLDDQEILSAQSPDYRGKVTIYYSENMNMYGDNLYAQATANY